MRPGSQHIFIDESGRPEVFNRKGENLLEQGTTSRYLVIAAVSTVDPQALAREVARACTPPGRPPRVPHAVKDTTNQRIAVLESIARSKVLARAIVMDKGMLNPEQSWYRDPARFYNEMLAYLIGDQLHLHANSTVVMSRKDWDAQQELDAMGKSIDQRHREVLRRVRRWQRHEIKMELRTHKSSRGLQAADYVAWAVFQAFERGVMEHVRVLDPVLATVWDIGRVTHYTRRAPLLVAPK